MLIQWTHTCCFFNEGTKFFFMIPIAFKDNRNHVMTHDNYITKPDSIVMLYDVVMFN